MKKTITTFAIATILSTFSAAPVHAVNDDPFDYMDANKWMIRARIIDVHPDSDSSATGASVFVDNQIVPELDITYFWTDNIATELILATSPHELETAAGADLGDTWVLPPQLIMQYHFQPDHDVIRPYAGVGLGYLYYYNENSSSTNTLELEGGISYTAQVGADFPIDDNWAFNVDAKRIFNNVDAYINGAKAADVDLDPWVLGVGIGYRF